MEFQKLDDNTVRCILTQEDMEERGLHIEDFFTDKEKTRNFLEDIVRMAHEEIGYENTSETLAMQVMPLPKNGLSITFSDRNDVSLQSMIGHIRSALEEIKTDDMNAMLEELEGQVVPTEDKEVKKQKNKSDKRKKKVFFRVYEFNNMSQVEGFCATIPEDLNIKSQLYKNEEEGKYYLVIEKGRISLKNLEKACIRALEFGTLVSTKETHLMYCREHYQCVIKKGAVKVLRKLSC